MCLDNHCILIYIICPTLQRMTLCFCAYILIWPNTKWPTGHFETLEGVQYCPVCEKRLHENCTVLSKTCVFCGSYEHSEIFKPSRKLERCKKESHNDREHWKFWLHFYLLQLHYFVFQYMWGNIHHPSAKDVLLHTIAIFITLSKDSQIFCKELIVL